MSGERSDRYRDCATLAHPEPCIFPTLPDRGSLFESLSGAPSKNCDVNHSGGNAVVHCFRCYFNRLSKTERNEKTLLSEHIAPDLTPKPPPKPTCGIPMGQPNLPYGSKCAGFNHSAGVIVPHRLWPGDPPRLKAEGRWLGRHGARPVSGPDCGRGRSGRSARRRS